MTSDNSNKTVKIEALSAELKQVKQELKRITSRHHLILNSTGEGIYGIDLEGCGTFINKAATEMLGYKVGELIGEKQHPLIHHTRPDGTPYPIEECPIYAAFKDGQTQRVDSEYFWRKDGSSFPVEYTSIPNLDETGKLVGAIVIFHDITERKQIEETLRKSEQQYLHLYNNSPDMYASVDAKTAKVILCNKTLTSKLGYTKEEIINQDIFNLYHSDSQAKAKQAFKLFTSEGEVHDTELKLIKKDGTSLEVVLNVTSVKDKDGVILYSRSVWHDISRFKQTDNVINKQKEQLQKYFDAGLVGMAIISPDKGWIRFNDTLCEITGYSQEEFKQKTWDEMTHPEDLELDITEFNKIISGEQEGYSLEKRFLHKNGNIIQAIISVKCIRKSDNSIDYFLAIFMDITEQKQANKLIHEQKEQLQRYFDVGLVGMSITSPKKGWIQINNTLCEIIGYSREELKQMTWEKLTHPEDIEANNAEFEKVLSGIQDEYSLEKRYIHKKGHTIHVFVSVKCIRKIDGSINYFLSLVIDITKRKQAEEALLKNRDDLNLSKQRLSLALEGAGFGLWDWNLVTDELFTNDTWDQILGYPPTASGNTLERLTKRLHPDDLEKAIAKIQEHLAGNTDIYRSEHREKTTHGEWKWVLDIGKVVERDEKNKPLRMVGIKGSIDETKQIQIQLEQSKTAAEAANLAKSQFLASMSHELRTPLHAIIGFTNIMQQSPKLDKEHSSYIDIINESGDHLLALINDILDIAKIEADRVTLEKNDIDLNNFLETILSMLSMRAQKKDILLFPDYAENLPEFISVDSLKLRQVLINLLGNAIKFTGKGKVVLKVTFEQQEDKQGLLHFEIHDTGVGIKSDEKQKLFQPFTQTEAGRQSASGTGLGLSISQHFAQIMGGQIQVTSTPGQGSIFSFTIPITLAETGTSKPNEREVSHLAPGQTTPTILLVEDMEYNRLLLINQLKRVGFTVHTANNGHEGIRLFNDIQPDIIFMDILMPIMDGKIATQKIRQLSGGNKVKIIALTANAFKDDRAEIIACGCDDVLFKPLQMSLLYSLLHQMLGIEFIYEEEIVTNTDQLVVTNKINKDQLTALPDSWAALFRQAAIEGDIDVLYRLLNELPETQISIKQQLTRIVDDYQFDAVGKILAID